MFSPCKDKTNYVYNFIQADYKREDYGDLNKYPGIDMDCLSDD